MITKFKYGNQIIRLNIPESAIRYLSSFKDADGPVNDMLDSAIMKHSGSVNLFQKLEKRGSGNVIIVVSDITRPIPYYQFLPRLLERIEVRNVKREDIIILIATGMHRRSTISEKREMFGASITENYRIIDHEADNPEMLFPVERKDKPGTSTMINRYYAEAGFRITTGLVEPHFMAGFSGGRKAICPGLVSLSAVQDFHGQAVLSHPLARNGQIDGNPCHDESLSIASLMPPDYTINIILDQEKRINRFTCGDLIPSHKEAIEFVKAASCPDVISETDLVITSCGGYPLDATFYQCVKAFVNCLPAVKKNGTILAFGGCSEGIGSPEYLQTMFSYSGRYKEFLEEIRKPGVFVKDQWQFQMHCRVLEKVGEKNLLFLTSGVPLPDLRKLSVNPRFISDNNPEKLLQNIVDKAASEGKRIACIPEGPYCAPLNNVKIKSDL